MARVPHGVVDLSEIQNPTYMKLLMVLLCCLALGACSSSNGVFSDATLRYGNPDTMKMETVPAVVYVKKGKIKSVIVEQ